MARKGTATDETSRGPTMRDVARVAGVSSATVSYVLNNLNKVTPEVDAHVRKVAREMGYSRNSAARALKTGRHNVIGCIVPTLASPVFPEIVQAVQRRAEELGYATFVIDSGEGPRREAQAIQSLAKHGVDGAVALLASRPPLADLPQFPIVAIDQPVPGLDSVRADHRTGGRLMAEHVIALGHKRVGLVSGGQDLLSSRERHEGFMDAARGKLDICWDVEVSLIPTLPQTAVDAIRRRDVTMIACVNDVVAIGVLSVLRDSGIAVPAEVSVFGFDDMVWSDWPLIDLTTIRQPLAELGRDAVELLVDRLNDPTRPQTDIVLPVSLTERGSTRAL